MTSTWPPQWTGPNFKAPKSRKVVRGLKRKKVKAAEDAEMQKVRRRDKYCRFPLCGCKKFGLRLEVSHKKHRGMGGNPKLDRTTPDQMILLCSARHQENRIAVDRGTLHWQALTTQGANGPVAWMLDIRDLPEIRTGRLIDYNEIVLARETSPHVFAPFTPEQKLILETLREMEF